MGFYAARDITPGEELTFNYGKQFRGHALDTGVLVCGCVTVTGGGREGRRSDDVTQSNSNMNTYLAGLIDA